MLSLSIEIFIEYKITFHEFDFNILQYCEVLRGTLKIYEIILVESKKTNTFVPKRVSASVVIVLWKGPGYRQAILPASQKWASTTVTVGTVHRWIMKKETTAVVFNTQSDFLRSIGFQTQMPGKATKKEHS